MRWPPPIRAAHRMENTMQETFHYMASTSSKPAERVKNTALILDHVQPGWAEVIDMDVFDMSNKTTDVAALLDRPYDLVYDDPIAMQHLTDLALMPGFGEGWDLINDAWCVEIFDRRTVKT